MLPIRKTTEERLLKDKLYTQLLDIALCGVLIDDWEQIDKRILYHARKQARETRCDTTAEVMSKIATYRGERFKAVMLTMKLMEEGRVYVPSESVEEISL